MYRIPLWIVNTLNLAGSFWFFDICLHVCTYCADDSRPALVRSSGACIGQVEGSGLEMMDEGWYKCISGLVEGVGMHPNIIQSSRSQAAFLGGSSRVKSAPSSHPSLSR